MCAFVLVGESLHHLGPGLFIAQWKALEQFQLQGLVAADVLLDLGNVIVYVDSRVYIYLDGLIGRVDRYRRASCNVDHAHNN